eukprot:278870_1
MGATCTKCWYRNTSCIEHLLNKIFNKWGIFVSKHPLITIILSLILACTLSIFTFFIQSETDIENLFAPKGTISFNNYNKYKQTWQNYEDNIGTNNIIVSDKHNPSENILTTQHLLLFHKIYQDIINIEIDYNNTKYKYNDICYRYENGNCQTRSILELYQYNATIIQQQFNPINIKYPTTYSSYSYKQLFLPLVLGQNISTQMIDISNDINTPSPISNINGFHTTNFFSTSIDITSVSNYIEIVTAAPAFQMSFALDIGYFGNDICLKWYDEFLNIAKEYAINEQKNDLFNVSYEGYNSFNDELSRAVASDITSFVTAFMLLSVFSTIMVLRFKRNRNAKYCSLRFDMLRCRGRIGWIGIISSILAVGSSFGLVGGILKIKFNSVVSIAPFLLVGLGLDDMFVLLRAYELTSPLLTIEQRMALTMERGGISILFTSITDLLAFCIGSTSSFGAISAFCIYCGIGVFMDFVFQVTFFLGFMVYDSRYQERDSCKECCCGHAYVGNLQPNLASKDAVELQIRNSSERNDAKYMSGSSDRSRNKYDMIQPEASSYVMDKLGQFLLNSGVVKAVVILIFIMYLVAATLGILRLHAYQDPVDLAPRDSYLAPTYETLERYFDVIGPRVQFVMDKKLDYSDSDVIDYIYNMVFDIRNDECFINNTAYTSSWIHGYIDYLDVHYPNDMIYINNTLFYDILYNEYLISTNGEQYIDDIWSTIVTQEVGFSSFDVDNETDAFGRDIIGEDSYQYIDRSRVWVNMKPIGRGTDKFKLCIDNLQSIQSKYKGSLGVYYFSFSALFAESDLVTIKQTIYNLLYASIAACFITIILIPYPLMALIVMTTVAQILYGVLGYMSLWGLPINTTTMINVVISVGFSVDNAAHFCHAFMNAPINTDGIVIYIDKKNTKLYTKESERYVRVLYALNAVGMPILLGDISTIVALLPLISAESEIFISFFKCILLVMSFGASYAVLYLPVILSMFGPLGHNNIINNDDSYKPTDFGIDKNELQYTKHDKNGDRKRGSLSFETYKE